MHFRKPITKYGAMIEECQPGTSDMPKSHPTIEWTEIITITMSGVMMRMVVAQDFPLALCPLPAETEAY